MGATNKSNRETLYLLFSLLLLCVTMNANCPKRWLIPDPQLQSKAVKATKVRLKFLHEVTSLCLHVKGQ